MRSKAVFVPDADTAQGGTTAGLSLLLLAECGVFLSISPATSYEPSIVTTIPVVFWLLFYAILGGAVCLLFLSAVTDSPYWQHAIGLLLANYAVFFFLPEVKGYKLYSRGKSDILSHLGSAKHIRQTGELANNFYPGQHVLRAEIASFGLSLETTTYVTAFLFTAVFILGTGLFVGALYGQRFSIPVGLAAAAPLVYTTFHLSNHPAVNSFMLVPTMLFLLERYRRHNDGASLALLLGHGIALVYTHPMTTIFASTIIFVTAVSTLAYRRYVDQTIAMAPVRLALVFLPLQFAWIRNTDRAQNSVGGVLATAGGQAPAGQAAGRAGSVSFSVLELIHKFIMLYGTTFVYLSLAGLIAVMIVGRRWSLQYDLAVAVAQFAVGVVLFLVFITTDLVVSDIVRVSRYGILFAIVLVALTVARLIADGRTMPTIGVVLVVLLAAGAGANGAHLPNNHLTHTEYEGTEFALTYTEEERIYSAGTRHAMEIYVLSRGDLRIFPPQISLEYGYPRNLGYTDAATVGETFGDSMLVTKDYDRRQHAAAYFTPEQQEFLRLYGPAEMDRLGNDRTANKVYTNGGYELWAVNGTDGV